MSQEREDFSKFGKSFQEDLCQLILNDRPFADQMFEVLDINFLELKYLRILVGKFKIKINKLVKGDLTKSLSSLCLYSAL